MNGFFGKDTIGMPRGSTLRIDDGAGVMLNVWEGELWLTEEGGRADHLLRAGQWIHLARGGATLAHAFRRCVVSLTANEAGCEPRCVTLTRAGSAAPAVIHRRDRLSIGGLLRGMIPGLRHA